VLRWITAAHKGEHQSNAVRALAGDAHPSGRGARRFPDRGERATSSICLLIRGRRNSCRSGLNPIGLGSGIAPATRTGARSASRRENSHHRKGDELSEPRVRAGQRRENEPVKTFLRCLRCWKRRAGGHVDPKEGERIGEFMLDISSRLAITRFMNRTLIGRC
jgi:hypothetical protein